MNHSAPRRVASHRLIRSGLVALTAAGVLAAPARAQSLDDLKQQIEALQKSQALQQKRIDQLESALRRATTEATRQTPRHAKPAAVARTTPVPAAASRETARQAAEDARQSAEQARLAATQAQETASQAKQASAQAITDAFTPPPGKPPGTFRIPNTGVSVRIYGQVKVNGSWDLTTFNRADALTAQSIALSGSAAARTGGDFQASARRSRIGMESWAPTDTVFGDVHALVEMDFAGQNTDLTTQSTANSYTPRLRRAFVDFGQPDGWGVVLLGQENSLFNDAAIFPLQWLADWTPGAMSGVRQAQARYTYGLGNGISASVAVENGYPDIATSTGISFPDSNGGNGFGFTQSPDFTARLMIRRDWGQFALRGVVRPQIELNNQGAITPGTAFAKSTSGWGIGATGNVNLFDNRVILMATGNYGDGIGRYLDATSNGFGAVSNAGLPGVVDPRINAVRVSAGLLGLQLNYTSNLRTNASLFGALLNYPSYVSQFAGCAGTTGVGTCNLVNRSLWGASVNLIWSPVRMIDVGVEYQHIERSLQSGNSTGNNGGKADRVQVSGIARF
ncbi:MAG: porin [Alphaproteobacteria bacterium]|nr:porin [Alphaproteobacteria bacterium]